MSLLKICLVFKNYALIICVINRLYIFMAYKENHQIYFKRKL